MIGYLKGKIIEKIGGSVILLVGGVGYRVTICPGQIVQTQNSNLKSQNQIQNSKTQSDQEIELYVHTHVREDALDLYGFKTKEELALFEMLLDVSGVGPRTAMLVIDQGVEAVQKAIQKSDVAFFTLIPRLGTKNAQKIIIELRGKLGSSGDLGVLGDSPETEEAIEALKTMGYTRKEAGEKLRGCPEGTTEEKIKYALKK